MLANIGSSVWASPACAAAHTTTEIKTAFADLPEPLTLLRPSQSVN